MAEFQKWYSKENGSKYVLFSFFDQVQGDNGEVFIKKSAVDHFNEERDYHGEIKSYLSNTVSRKVIKSFQRKHRLLYIFFLTIECLLIHPRNIPLFLLNKKQKTKTKQNKKTIEFLFQTAKLLLWGILMAWKHSYKAMKGPMCDHYKYIARVTLKIRANWNTVYVTPFVGVWYDLQFNISSLEWLILFENLTVSFVISTRHSLLPNF